MHKAGYLKTAAAAAVLSMSLSDIPAYAAETASADTGNISMSAYLVPAVLAAVTIVAKKHGKK